MRPIRFVTIVFFVSVFLATPVLYARQPAPEITAAWIRRHLRRESPRLMLTPGSEKQLRTALKKDSLAQAGFALMRQRADKVCTLPPLERKLTGRRLLDISRQSVDRIGTLAMTYRLTGEKKYLNRLAQEITTVCNFTDWNPSHFLDVAEMAYAVSIGIDWAGKSLDPAAVQTAKKALREKAIAPGFEDKFDGWVDAEHNWNQVCHGGMVAAALAIADEDPALAARVIQRAINKIPVALKKGYAPDGLYPEGPSYWNYGTWYSVLTFSMLESALGTDFGLSQAPGFLASATYRLVMQAPSGACFNFSDSNCPDGLGDRDRSALIWFARKTGNALFLDREKLLMEITQATNQKTDYELSPASLIWLAQCHHLKPGRLPTYWQGTGENSIAVFRAEPDEQTGFYLAVKGGTASANHANMDAGSFILEMGGVRWSVDPGNQNYNELEQIMGAGGLWDRTQDSPRWTLLTKNNQHHSTLTVNDQRHKALGYASIGQFAVNQPSPTVSLNLQEIFAGQLRDAVRTFTKTDARTVRIRDSVTLADNTETITWAMMTQAEVTTIPGGAVLTQNNRQLQLTVRAPESASVSVIALNPPPLPYDKAIPGLKRVEIRLPAYVFKDAAGVIDVELQLKE